ncbi:hypothetical protein VTL71DRAFT_3202 [Oculimacula yallundae]|uniref:Uncharacterized protein n=1 Tax=Oculimacula yallundae TaxID=86028 RepID=A0ABR4C7B1_9HELO
MITSGSILLALILTVNAYRQAAKDTRRGVRWLEQNRMVLVRLEIPNLFPSTAPEPFANDAASCSLIFNFTLENKRTLLLNGVPIFPLRNAYVPPQLYAHQSTISLTEFERGQLPDFDDGPLYVLDYHREVPVSEHPSMHYNVFKTQLALDVLGAETKGEITLLPDDTQRLILVNIDEVPPYQDYPFDKSISEIDLMLSDTRLQDRYPYNTPFPAPESLMECTLWSWSCSDIDEYPWYRYIYRQAFDRYGKIGSFRHMLLKKWGQLCIRFGFWHVMMMVVVGVGLLVSPIVYGLNRCISRTQSRMRRLYRRGEQLELRGAGTEAECLLHFQENEGADAEGLPHYQDNADDEDAVLLRFEDNEEAGEDRDDSVSNADVAGAVNGRRSLDNPAHVWKPLPPIPLATSDVP